MIGFASKVQLDNFGLLSMNCRNLEFISRYNKRRLYPLVDNKLLTKQAALAADIAVPELIGSVKTPFEVNQLEQILGERTKFVIKPARGSAGKGILVITRREGNDFYKASGSKLSLQDLKRDISNILSGLYSLGGKPDVALIESLIQFDPGLARYSYQGVPDIRVIVFQGYPVMAMLRCSTAESDGKANLHQGAVGVGLAVRDGKARSAVQNGDLVSLHPDTNEPFGDLQIPHWETILQLTARCYELTGLGYIGCDVVLDSQLGPLILELNARPGLAIQIANQRGLLPRLRHVEALQPNPDIDARVQLAASTFDQL
ncbi:alpha-L-glutamate ligase-like protein [Motiliproteus sediminis]|uniref:alpha-L-glutamate ligase-like protein n=1 Tax=Motiliproteus sediminis TaxID=1468178 RepID=UPI001AEF9383|nr:alpha-L-glutamate ligase-like protein [Motiliproteus sediminis]